MTKSDNTKEEVVTSDYDDYKKITELIRLSTKLSDDEINDFHIKMWIFTHGIASLICTGRVVLSDKEIEALLSSEFQALMLLEDNPNNKWDLSKYKDWRGNNE